MSKLPKKQESTGSPAWVMTFADLMSLLMCFFVLLLSFSEMDLQKYKQVAGSMKFAFGVQKEIKTMEMPKGTSIIAREFSPGKPSPTVINVIRQNSIDETKQTLEFTDAVNKTEESENVEDTKEGKASQNAPVQSMIINKISDLIIQTEKTDEDTLQDAEKLLETLEEEVTNGIVEIETAGKQILIRIREKGSFPSGTATLKGGFLPVLGKLREALKFIEGRILIAGHTDDIPISNSRFRSNWELSASRAVTVLHELLENNTLEQNRFLVEGHGEANPLLPNTTAENRALNRRVEITIVQGESDNEFREISPEQESSPGDEQIPAVAEGDTPTQDPFPAENDGESPVTATLTDGLAPAPDPVQQQGTVGSVSPMDVAGESAEPASSQGVELSPTPASDTTPATIPEAQQAPSAAGTESLEERIKKFSQKIEKHK